MADLNVVAVAVISRAHVESAAQADLDRTGSTVSGPLKLTTGEDGPAQVSDVVFIPHITKGKSDGNPAAAKQRSTGSIRIGSPPFVASTEEGAPHVILVSTVVETNLRPAIIADGITRRDKKIVRSNIGCSETAPDFHELSAVKGIHENRTAIEPGRIGSPFAGTTGHRREDRRHVEAARPGKTGRAIPARDDINRTGSCRAHRAGKVNIPHREEAE